MIDQILYIIKKSSFVGNIGFTHTHILLVALLVGLSSAISAQQSKTDSLLSVLKYSKPDTNKVKTFCLLSQALNEIKPTQGLIYAKQGLELAQQLKFRKGQSITLNALALSYYQIGNFDSAMINFDKQFAIVRKMDDSIGIAGVYDNMGVIYIHRGDLNKALELREKANHIYLTHNKRILLASGYTWIGNIYKEQGEYSKALDYYLKAVKIYENENDKKNIGVTFINISSIYRYLKQYGKAKNHALDAKKIFEKTGNIRGIGVSLYRLALVYNEEGDFENTLCALKEAKAIFDKIEDSYFLTLINLQLGNTYRSKKQNELAFKYLNTALTDANKIGDKSLTAAILENIGTVYCDKNDFSNGLKYMHISERIFKEINDQQTLRSMAQNFIEIFSRINRPDSVMLYFQKYQQLSDSLYNEQSSKAIAEIQTKYETEKKDKEIATLNLQSQKRKNTMWLILSGLGFLPVLSGSAFWVFQNKKKKEHEILKRKIGETDRKALRAQMNPHFIFNCVDSIERLLDDAKIKESKISLAKFSKLTRTVLENSAKREIPLSEEIEIIRLYMDLENMRFKKPFTCEIVIDAGIDPSTTLIPPLIMQPFVENAIKHGFRDPLKPGLLKIKMLQENGSLVCIVEDNGAGRNMHQNDKPTSGYKKESMGMQLTEDRLKLIGEMKKAKSYFIVEDLIDTYNEPAGTRVRIFLPFEQSI